MDLTKHDQISILIMKIIIKRREFRSYGKEKNSSNSVQKH